MFLNILDNQRLPLFLKIILGFFVAWICSFRPVAFFVVIIVLTIFYLFLITKQIDKKSIYNTILKIIATFSICYFLIPTGTSRWFNTGIPCYDEVLSISTLSADNIFHTAYSSIIKNYGVISSGLHGLTPTFYHVGSHLFFSVCSKILGVSTIYSYTTVYQTAIIPFFFFAIYILSESLLEKKSITTNIPLFLINSLLVSGIINFIDDGKSLGSKFGIGNGIYASQSYTLGLSLSLVFLSDYFTKSFSSELKKIINLLVVFTALFMVKISSLLTLSSLLIKEKIKVISLFIIIGGFLVIFGWGDYVFNLNLSLKPFEVGIIYFNVTPNLFGINYFLTLARFLFVHYFYFFLFTFIFFLHKQKLHKNLNINQFFNFCLLYFLLSITILCLIPASGNKSLLGAAHLFFSEPINFFSIAGLSSLIFIKPIGEIKKTKKVLIFFITLFAINNFIRKTIVNYNNLNSYKKYSCEASWAKIFQLLINYRNIAKDNLIYIPKSNKMFWTIGNKNWNDLTIPYLVPALTEHPGIYILPDLTKNQNAKLYLSYNHYSNNIFYKSSEENISEQDLKTEVERLKFKKVYQLK